MKRPKRDPVRKDRIQNEAIVDAVSATISIPCLRNT
jgi:hypothetical protein